MSKRAWSYIIGILLSAIALSLLAGQQLHPSIPQLLTLTILVTITTIAHLFEAEAPNRQSYYPSMIFLFAGVVLLPPGLFVVLAAFPHMIEWAKERIEQKKYLRAWYIQPFNIATHIIAGISAQLLYQVLLFYTFSLNTASPVLSALGAVIAYVLINHILIGLALVLARGIPWSKSGVLELENLLPDFVNLCLGYIVAVFWSINPWLIVPVLSPIVLIYRALTVPQLKQEAQTDAKTGLLNARYFNKLFAEEFDRAQRFGRPLALIVADLDLMRNINNTYGHLAGDVVLTGIGEILRSSVRKYDLAARFGGEEFCIALPEVDAISAMALAERIRASVEAASFTISTSSHPIRATLSVGVACFPHDGANTTELLHAADVAVYQAKLSGRNRVVYTADVPHSVTLEQMQAEAAGQVRYTPVQAVDSQSVPHTEPAPLPAPVHAEAISSAPASTDNLSPSPKASTLHPVFWLFTGGVIALGIGIALWGAITFTPIDIPALLLLVGLTFLAELLQISIGDNVTFSVSVALVFAIALIAGIPGLTYISTIVVLIHYIKYRPAFYKTAFNWATHMLSGIAPAMILPLVGVPLHVAYLPLLLPAAIIAALAHYFIETGLFATFISFTNGNSARVQWREQFGWLARHYVALCVMGLFLGLAYTSIGAVGVLIFTLPVVMMRSAQKQYTERTSDSLRELRRMNQELSRANGEIMAASQSIRQLNDELFMTLAKIIDARDPYAAGHAGKVADYALMLARELNLSPEQQNQVHQAGLLHDIGKLGIPEEILNKPDKLTPEEYAQIKTHAQLGAEFLETCQGLRHLSIYVRHHHERWDGRGYPDSLAAEQIPLISRILNVCDSVEAMASDRPYHRGLSPERVIAEVQRQAGRQFDPVLVAAFVRMVEREGVNVIMNSALAVEQKSRALVSSPQVDERTLRTLSSNGAIMQRSIQL